MYTTGSPLPPEELPPGWGAVTVTDDRLVYRHVRSPIELVIVCTATIRSYPPIGHLRCWELRYQYTLDDRTTTGTIGSVTTLQAALSGLRECMHRIYLEEPSDPFGLRRLLETVSLPAPVPDDPS